MSVVSGRPLYRGKQWPGLGPCRPSSASGQTRVQRPHYVTRVQKPLSGTRVQRLHCLTRVRRPLCNQGPDTTLCKQGPENTLCFTKCGLWTLVKPGCVDQTVLPGYGDHTVHYTMWSLDPGLTRVQRPHFVTRAQGPPSV